RDDVPSGGTFVWPQAQPGGDGSREAPYATVAEALSGHANLATDTSGVRLIVLSQGEHHVGRLEISSGVELRGTCTSSTVLVVDSATEDAFHVVGGQTMIRDLT